MRARLAMRMKRQLIVGLNKKAISEHPLATKLAIDIVVVRSTNRKRRPYVMTSIARMSGAGTAAAASGVCPGHRVVAGHLAELGEL